VSLGCHREIKTKGQKGFGRGQDRGHDILKGLLLSRNFSNQLT